MEEERGLAHADVPWQPHALSGASDGDGDPKSSAIPRTPSESAEWEFSSDYIENHQRVDSVSRSSTRPTGVADSLHVGSVKAPAGCVDPGGGRTSSNGCWT